MTLSRPRRDFLLLMGAGALPLRSQTPAASMTVSLDREIAPISPLIYSHFVEHIGRVVYEGIWVGPNSRIPNQQGIRLDVIQALKRVQPAAFRWPGGCFADTYRWQDGVGPAEKRVARPNHWWQRQEPNTFGTDEFMAFCRLFGAEPYLSANVGSGSVSDALDWLQYCNGTDEVGYAAMRRANGQSSPYNVKWWGIGNETWGCGGQMTPAEYAHVFRQYGVFFKRLGLTQGLELVGVGHNSPEWNPQFLAALGGGLPYLDHLSVHQYFRFGDSTHFTDAEYLRLMFDLDNFEKLIAGSIAAIEAVEPQRAKIRLFGGLQPKPIGLVIDEWGVWHSDSQFSDGFSQKGVLRDALFAASALNLFHRYAKRISMSNIAQLDNCLHSLIVTQDARMALTPTFYVYEMYRGHQGATAVQVDQNLSPSLSVDGRSRPAVSISASRRGTSALVTLVNQDPGQDFELELKIRGGRPVEAKATILTGPDVRSLNTVDQSDVVKPKEWKAAAGPETIRTHLPARSVEAIEIRLG
jgi:alpha-N-arabinofuranosidase